MANINTKANLKNDAQTMTFLRHGRRPQGEFNSFWRALNSTNQFESPFLGIFKQNATDEKSVTSAREKNAQLLAAVRVSKTSVLKLS